MRDTHKRPGRAGALAITAGLVLLTAACGGSPGGANSPSASATPGSVAAAFSARLAFVRCIRAHGVRNYPDPDSNGLEPPGTKQLFVNDPRFPAAVGACSHLLPEVQPTVARQRDAMTEDGALRLARCMRAHGFPAFPDPTTDSAGQPVFNVQAAGIPPHSPQVLAALRGCVTRLHLTGLPTTSH